jgi:hypothetical protein
LAAALPKVMEGLNERLYEHPNFVWLDQLAVTEILNRRRANNCHPVTILNNLLRWSLYQVILFYIPMYHFHVFLGCR